MKMKDKTLWVTISLLIVICLLFVIDLLKGYRYVLFSANSEQLALAGDFAGGVIGTILGFISLILLIVTFRDQRRNFSKERFENRFFEMVDIYRATVDEMNIADAVSGRKCFVSMYKEFKALYTICHHVYYTKALNYYQTPNEKELKFLKSIYGDNAWGHPYVSFKICEFAYILFFNGIGGNSKKHLVEHYGINGHFYDKVDEVTHTLQDTFSNMEYINYNFNKASGIRMGQRSFEFDKDIAKKIGDIFDEDALKPRIVFYEGKTTLGIPPVTAKQVFPLNFYPFDGHNQRLGHYYRLLLEIVRYVVSKEGGLLNREEVESYLKILRAQMSNHEQALLYYNGVAGFGSRWMKDPKAGDANYFVDYRMIHNVPFHLATFGINIKDYFKAEIAADQHLFEGSKPLGRRFS